MPEDESAPPSGRRRRTSPPDRPSPAPPDPLDADFGPGPAAEAPYEPRDEDEAPPAAEPQEPREPREPRRPFAEPPFPPHPGGIFPGLACGGDACLLKPFANLFGKFGLRLVLGHGASLSRVASSGIELMRALRDFLDEEIALAEKAAAAPEAPRYEKIRVD